MLVALRVASVQTLRVDGELHCGLGAQRERALVAVEVPFDRYEPVEVAYVELNARAAGVKVQTPLARSLAAVEDGSGVVLIVYSFSLPTPASTARPSR